MVAAISTIEKAEVGVLITSKRISGSDNGLILARLVRVSSNPNIPVIMITRDIGAGAPPTNPVIIAAKQAGVDIVIDKYNLESRGAEFLATIDALLAGKAEVRKLG